MPGQIHHHSLLRSTGVSDTNAQTYIGAIISCNGSLAQNIQDAINNFFVGLKSDLLWDKIYAMWPFIGGTACAHKWNAKDPRDLNAAYRLHYLAEGNMVHSANGVKPSVSRADTYFRPNMAGQNSFAMWYYSREATTETGTMMGIGGSGTQTLLIPRFSNGSSQNYDTVNANMPAQASVTNTSGLLGVNRINATEIKSFRNGVSYKTTLSNSVTPLADPIYIFGRFAVNQFTTLQCAFGAFTQGFTDSEALAFYNRIQTLQTALGRQV